jgi:hypothetical protein
VSGSGEAALDRALADPTVVEKHLGAVRAGQSTRASVWAQDAIRLVTSWDPLTAAQIAHVHMVLSA